MRFHSVLVLASGLALTSSISAQTAPPRQTPTQTNLYPPTLYQMNDVSKTLKLNQEQINSLNKVTGQVQTQYRDDYNKLSTLNEAERFERAQELNRKYYSDWNKGARDVFNDTQRTRYQQFNYQYGGFNSFYDPDVQKQLNLTPEQVKDLREHSDWSNKQWEEIHRMGATDPTKGIELYGDYWKQRQERFNKYLTPEQQKAWSGMTGDPYRFQPSFRPNR
jgi:hypothetical protein